MSWTTANDIKSQVRRLWDRGGLLGGLVTGENIFPFRLKLKGPDTKEFVDKFDAARAWIDEIRNIPFVRIEWREFKHRILGTQRVPASAWIDDRDSAIAAIGMRNERIHFDKLLAFTRDKQPLLAPWLAQWPLLALSLRQEWGMLLAVIEWLQQHPRPGIHLRQVDIPGLHSKFIENNRSVLAALLDLALPPEAIDVTCIGASQFAQRYGFLSKPTFIRLRVLDAALSPIPQASLPDMALDAESFARLELPVQRVIITENEINHLAFPPVAGAIVIFGKGYGWDSLAKATWLKRCPIYYWGDIDTNGFAILDQLRSRFDHVESFLMDRETFMAHEALWVEEPDQVNRELPRLTDTEREVYDALRFNHIRKGLRLEQERVGFGWVEAAVDNMLTLRS